MIQYPNRYVAYQQQQSPENDTRTEDVLNKLPGDLNQRTSFFALLVINFGVRPAEKGCDNNA